MCRIAGIVDFKTPPTIERIVSMRDSMKHGGPDDDGIYMDDTLPLAFGHRRLSFQDLSPNGHQPMLDPSKNIVLIFNGEIYNFKEIRKELVSSGYSFMSFSDTEVILFAYLKWGKNCFSKFKGMFALAILDKRTNTLLLARDRMGIKPLYYSIGERSVYFASEVRAFKNINPGWNENKDWKKYFLIFGHLPEPITTLEGVQELERETIFEIQIDSFTITTSKYHSFQYPYTIRDKHVAVQTVKSALEFSVQRHLLSDAPVGLFLSGGLDSSLLTVLAGKWIPSNLQTLSIIFEDKNFSEKYFQDLIIRETGANHKSYLISKADFFASLPDIIKAMDQPSTDGINSYFISKYAHEFGLKAALSGIGADELFGGYPSFNRASMIGKVNWLPNFIFEVVSLMPEERLKRVVYLGVKDGLGEHLFNRGIFSPSQVAELLQCTEQEIWQLISQMSLKLPINLQTMPEFERVSYFETNFYMQNRLLKDTDCMSMWHGLEVRVPFLDDDLIESVYSIDPSIRYDRQLPKALLVEAFQHILPREIVHRPKQGFNFPFGEWMRELPQVIGRTNDTSSSAKGIPDGANWSQYWSVLLTQGVLNFIGK